MWRLGKPIIAAVNGWALGAGFWYQLAADVTIASDQAVFAQPEVRHISATSFLFTALCGWKAANRWGLTGDHFDAQEALRIGMVNEVVPHDELMASDARAREAHGARARAGAAPQQGHRDAGHPGRGASCRPAAGRRARARSFIPRTTRSASGCSISRPSKGTKAYLEARDGPFQPEPHGPALRQGSAAKSQPDQGCKSWRVTVSALK